MTKCVGFPVVTRHDARVLILGSLPGAESLRQQQYYAKKQNSFWKIMDVLIGTTPDMPYATKLDKIRKSHIALWDVCATAQRVGSLDSNILFPVVNDFVTFFKKHPNIELICFNGQPAEKLFRRYAMPLLPEKILRIPRVILPSTSPAHASLRFEGKLKRWREALSSLTIQSI